MRSALPVGLCAVAGTVMFAGAEASFGTDAEATGVGAGSEALAGSERTEAGAAGAGGAPPSSARCLAAADKVFKRATFCSNVSPATGPVSLTPAYVERLNNCRFGCAPVLCSEDGAADGAAGFAGAAKVVFGVAAGAAALASVAFAA